MAKTTAPLFSFGASGQIAKSLVASNWKGRSYMRRYTVPANPKTDAQVAHRAIFSAGVAAYKNYLVNGALRAGWNLLASLTSPPVSGFNAAQKALVAILTTNGDASFATEFAEASQVATITMKNMDDGATGDEAGNFEVWKGSTPAGMTLLETQTIAAGAITTSDLGAAEDVVYIAIRKDSEYRSGIMRLVLT